MAEPQFLIQRTRADTLSDSRVRSAMWLSGAVFLALLVLYFVGLDQGATSIVGGDSHIHEFMHDARHLLGFPCH
jgi:cobalt transporter subunit CbtB